MKSWQRKHKAKMNTIRNNNALFWRVLSTLSIGVCGYDVYKRLNGSEAERVKRELMEMEGK